MTCLLLVVRVCALFFPYGRILKIHEYQAKEIFRQFGVPTPNGRVATTIEEAKQAAHDLGKDSENFLMVVKSQVHAGGRGKGIFVNSDGGRGVRVARSIEEVETFARAMLGHRLQTVQTGPTGSVVRKLYIEEGLPIAQELYLGVTLDRDAARLVFMASAEGGTEIEEVAVTHPEKIFKQWVEPVVGFQPYQGRLLAEHLGISGNSAQWLTKLCCGLYQAFVSTDASLCEINPLAVLQDGRVVALDGKLSFDENALFRHPELQLLRDPDEDDSKEAHARKFDLSYISLTGDIGCMVNGAGLAMATMDTIQQVGGRPANFLDVGGSASRQKVGEAFKLLLSDPNVKAVLVNIFGGIMKCDVIAEGIVEAAQEIKLEIPLVVRLEGTHVEKGKEILQKSNLKIFAAQDLRQAAEKAVAAAKGQL